jgi:2-phosphoglycerate kinase
MQSSSDWRVLLVCGASGTGKTTAAQALARRLGISALLVDDLRISLQALTTPESHPGLHIFTTDKALSEMTPEEGVRGFVETARAVEPAVRTVIGHHIVVPGSGQVLIEGDGLLPSLGAAQSFADLKLFWGLRTEREVRGAVVHEPDEAVMFETFAARGRGFGDLVGHEQRALVHACWRFGDWLRDEAAGLGVPVVPSRPFETLPDRLHDELLGTGDAGR